MSAVNRPTLVDRLKNILITNPDITAREAHELLPQYDYSSVASHLSRTRNPGGMARKAAAARARHREQWQANIASDLQRETLIQDVGFSGRTLNSLSCESQLRTVGDLVDLLGYRDGAASLLRLPNFGQVCLTEILFALEPLLNPTAEQQSKAEFIEWCLANREQLEIIRLTSA